MLHAFLKAVAPAVALGAAMSLSACDGHVAINGEQGKPLAEIDTAGKRPRAVVLAGPDSVVIRDGGELRIEVAGDPDAVAALRFTLDDTTLGILRKSEARTKDTATVTVTMPSLEKLTLAGSGSIDAATLGGSPEVVIAGSGIAHTARVTAQKLDVTIAGSGTYRAGGTADTLALTVAGSGKAAMAGLSVKQAKVTVAGSGDAAFASDGTVEASIMGSGDITVTGSATCTVKSMGSGSLRCRSAATADAGPPAPPTPPATPAV